MTTIVFARFKFTHTQINTLRAFTRLPVLSIITYASTSHEIIAVATKALFKSTSVQICNLRQGSFKFVNGLIHEGQARIKITKHSFIWS